MEVVRQRFVYVLPFRGGDKGGDGEIDITEEEEGSYGQSGAEGGSPLVRLAVEVEVYKAPCNKDVDDCQGVGDDAADSLAVILSNL